MVSTIRKLLELIRFSHTVFALPFALLSAMIAWTLPIPGESSKTAEMATEIGTASSALPMFQWRHPIGIICCMVFARSAAMAFNRLADRDVDAGNPRTQNRHLATGTLSVVSVTWFSLLNSIGFVASTLIFLPNPWPFRLAVPVLLFLLAYSWTKRFTSLSHFWLGMALMLAPICTWIAIRGQIVTQTPADILPAVIVGLAVLMWVAGFDMIYACQDAEFDRRAKLRSIPARLGIPRALQLAAICHAAMVGLLIALPFACPAIPLGWIYAAGVLGVATLLTVEHAMVRPHDLTKVNLAFLHVNSVISMGLFLIVTLDLFV